MDRRRHTMHALAATGTAGNSEPTLQCELIFHRMALFGFEFLLHYGTYNLH